MTETIFNGYVDQFFQSLKKCSNIKIRNFMDAIFQVNTHLQIITAPLYVTHFAS